MKKIMVVLGVVIVVGLAALILNRNVLARFIIVDGIKKTTGLDVKIDRMNIGLPHVAISGLKIYNPAGFKERLMADIPEVSVDFDLPAFFKNKVHLGALKIDMKELHVILNEQGKLNVNSLALLVPKKGTGKPPEVKIDTLKLKIGKVVYGGDFSFVGVKSMEFDPGIDETFHDVTNPSEVAAQILRRILARIGIGKFASFDVTATPVQAVKEAAQGAMDTAKEGLGRIFSTGK